MSVRVDLECAVPQACDHSPTVGAAMFGIGLFEMLLVVLVLVGLVLVLRLLLRR